MRVAQEAMWKGIRAVRPGAFIGDIGYAIEKHAKKNGYSVVRDYCGHGIGREMHEEPQVLNHGRPGTGVRLQEGMVFTVEPMVNQGTRRVTTADDGWTVVTNDGKLSAQFEHTVAVTATGVEVLTLRRDEKLAASGSATLPSGAAGSAAGPFEMPKNALHCRAIERFRFLRNRGSAPTLCSYAIPNRKPHALFLELLQAGSPPPEYARTDGETVHIQLSGLAVHKACPGGAWTVSRHEAPPAGVGMG